MEAEELVAEAAELTIAEKLVLFLLQDDTGFLAPIQQWRLDCALVGAALLDLSFEERIDSDLEVLWVVDPMPTGDEILDPLLAEIAREPNVHGPRHWVERLATHADQIHDRVFDRLVQRGILDHETGGFFSLSKTVARSGRYPLVDGRRGEEIRGRIMRTLYEDDIPDPHEVALIGLLRACRGFVVTLEPEEYAELVPRIDLIAGMDLFSRAVLADVQSSYTPPASLSHAGRAALPTLGLWQCLAAASFRAGNLPKFFAEQAERLGSAYMLKLPGKSLVVLAGAEANHWAGRNGRHHFRTRDYLENFQNAWGTSRSIASMDGADHFRMRKTVRAGNSRAVVEDRLDELFALGRASLRDWETAKAVPGETACQRAIGRQIARLSTSIDPPTEVLDGLLAYEFRSLLVHVMEILPKFALRTPAMRRAHKSLLALYRDIHASHSPAQREGKRRDLVDDLMDLHYADQQFLPETDMEFAFIAPLIAGHYVGSAMSFAIYDLMANPDLQERIAAEADALFSDGDPDAASLTMDAIDVTHRFVMESMRLHPVIPVHNRTAANSFVFDGKEIPARSTVLLAFTATHFMAEHFAEPEQFDIDRFAPPRNEHRKRGAYEPFGIGTHRCMGARFSELMMAADLLLIAHHFELEMVPADYELKLSPLPKTSPDSKFRFRVKRVRNPLPAPGDDQGGIRDG